MIHRHPSSELSAYHHHQLPLEREREVAGHLSGCARCRAELDEIAFAARLAKRLPRATVPVSLAMLLERPLIPRRAGQAERIARQWLPAAASLAAVILLGVFWYFAIRQPLRVAVAASPPNNLEQRAVAEHVRHLQGTLSWQLKTGDARALQRWLLDRAGLFAHLPEKRPATDAQYFRLIGTSLLGLERIDAAVIGYEIDGRPVTLVTAKLSQVRDAPAEARFSKSVFYRAEAAHGFHVLSWSTEGQAYVLVSALPHYGEQGCFLCHTTTARRALISRMNPR